MKRICLLVLGGLLLHTSTWADTDPANDTTGGADPLGISTGGATVMDAILTSSGGDVDFFEVTLGTDDVLTAMTTPVGLGGVFDDPDTIIGVFNGGEIVQNDDAGDDEPEGSEYGSLVRFIPSSAGTYFVAVSGCCDNFSGTHSQRGPYRLTVSIESLSASVGPDTDPTNDSTGGADPISVPEGTATVHTANLSALTVDVDYFAVAVGPGQVLTAATSPTGGTLDDPDTIIGVFGPGGQIVQNDDAGSDDPSGSQYGSLVRFTPTSSGTYYVAVSGCCDDFAGSHSESGEYVLTISVAGLPVAGPIPTLNIVGLLLLGVLLAVFGVSAYRRR